MLSGDRQSASLHLDHVQIKFRLEVKSLNPEAQAVLDGALQNRHQAPALGFGQWAGFDDLHLVADLAVVGFVMDVELVGTLEELAVQRMLVVLGQLRTTRVLFILSETTSQCYACGYRELASALMLRSQLWSSRMMVSRRAMSRRRVRALMPEAFTFGGLGQTTFEQFFALGGNCRRSSSIGLAAQFLFSVAFHR